MSKITIRMKNKAFLAALLVFASNAFAFDCPEHFPGVEPVVRIDYPKTRELCFTDMAILHSGGTKTPIYSVQKLNASKIARAKNVNRDGRFYEEARLPKTHGSSPDDYTRSGFDRGHMTPSGTQSSPEGMAQSFSMANIVPQDPKMNRVVWRKLEASVEKFVARTSGDVYVYTGPLFLYEKGYIGDGVKIPSHIWKLVLTDDRRNSKAWILENVGSATITSPISLSELEKHVGIKFTPRN